jgi:ATP-dependent RNA helicase A
MVVKGRSLGFDGFNYSKFQIIAKKSSFVKIKKNLKERSALPVSSFRTQILDVVQKNPVVIIRGATGCGKTTQIPQMLLEAYIESGRGAHCNIYVTQPRRISAVSVSERVASERSKHQKQKA